MIEGHKRLFLSVERAFHEIHLMTTVTLKSNNTWTPKMVIPPLSGPFPLRTKFRNISLGKDYFHWRSPPTILAQENPGGFELPAHKAALLTILEPQLLTCLQRSWTSAVHFNQKCSLKPGVKECILAEISIHCIHPTKDSQDDGTQPPETPWQQNHGLLVQIAKQI